MHIAGSLALSLVLYHPPPLDCISLGACRSTQHLRRQTPSPTSLSLLRRFAMCTTSSDGARSKITEMYNRMVLSEGAAAVEALRKKCEKWQGRSISEYTTTAPPQLMSSVLVERVNTLLSSMKKEMAIMDSNFCNELRNLKSGHDNTSSTRGDIVSVVDLHNDKISAANPNSSAEGQDILRALPKAGSAPEKTSARSACQGKNLIKPEKTFTKPASQAQYKAPIEHDKLKTKAKAQTVQQNSPRLVNTAKPTSKKTSKKPVCNSKL